MGTPSISSLLSEDNENAQTLSISLPILFVQFIENYIATHNIQSQSQVIIEALELLRAQEQKPIKSKTEEFKLTKMPL